MVSRPFIGDVFLLDKYVVVKHSPSTPSGLVIMLAKCSVSVHAAFQELAHQCPSSGTRGICDVTAGLNFYSE